MKSIAVIILLSFTLSLSAVSKEEAVDYLVQNYPKAQLVDIYKSFYQDNFGPGHLLADSLAAVRYFNEELKDTTEWRGPDYEFTGEGKNFVRVNMKLVKNGVIPADSYFTAFQNSIGRVDKPSDEFWIEEWMQIDSIISQRNYHFINEEKDRGFIKEKIASRNFPIHHSDNFNQNYNFHYRIISLPEFEKLKENFLISDCNILASNIYNFNIPAQNGDSIPMSAFKGKVLLIVNTASKCGFTPQYKDLEALYEKYHLQGLEILDFPCNQFGNQSPESDEETIQFCQLNYGTQFPQYKKIEVNGENELPLYGWLKSQRGFEGFDTETKLGKILDNMIRQQNKDYAASPDIKWNFTKFLVDRNGNVVQRFEPTTSMIEVEEAIVNLLN